MKHSSFSWLARMGGLCVLSLPMLHAQQTPTLVLRGGRVLDVGNGALGKPGQLWLLGERILGQRPLTAEIPAGAEVFEVDGCTLLPGFFDLHAHVPATGGDMLAALSLPAEEHLETQLYFGVTHVLDLHGDQSSIFKLRERSRGSANMARLYSAGAAFTAPGGHGTQFGIEANSVTSAAEVEARFEALLPKQPDVIKAILEHGGWDELPKLPTLSVEVFRAIAERSRAARLPLFSHVFSLEEARTAVDHGANALVHGVFIGEVDEALARNMLQREVGYVPTLAVVIGSMRASGKASPYNRDVVRNALHPDLARAVCDGEGSSWSLTSGLQAKHAQFFGSLKRLSDAGVLIGIGTDAGNPMTPHGPALIHELELYVQAGLSNAEALRAATRNSARMLGVQGDFGELKVGKIADVLVFEGNPLERIEELWSLRDVFKAGRLVQRDLVLERNRLRRLPARVQRVGAGIDELIDEFDDAQQGAAWGGQWTAFSDALSGGHSSAELRVQGGLARLRGELKPGSPFGAWASMGIQWDPEGKSLVDASGFEGIALRLRGSPRAYNLTLQRDAVKDLNVFATSLPVTEEWCVVEIPFQDLRQIGFGRPIQWSASDIKGINIDARNSPAGKPVFAAFELEVDWIRLY